MSTQTATLGRSELALLEESRHAVLATQRSDGGARLVPIAFAFDSETGLLYFALDEKPKSVADPRALARVRDIEARPQVSLLVHRWSEDWSQLAWLRLEGEASLLEPADQAEEHGWALHLLRQRYPQYENQRLEERPIVRIEIRHRVSWGL